MMLIAWIPILAAIGLLIYALAGNAKVARVGEILFFCGTLITLFGLTHTVRLL